jgi:hypothetical protein
MSRFADIWWFVALFLARMIKPLYTLFIREEVLYSGKSEVNV